MLEQLVQANSLSCLMNEDCTVEQIPEPFRMQGQISFRVTYSEYSNYILSLPMNSDVILMSDNSLLRNLASSGSPKLYSCFLKDLAFAICKELWYAECYNKDASVILPTAFNGNDIKLSDYLQYYSVCNGVELELVNKVHAAGYTSLKVKREHNISLFKMAVILYHMSKIPTVVKEVNLVYDLPV